jgi:hypothetical protein
VTLHSRHEAPGGRAGGDDAEVLAACLVTLRRVTRQSTALLGSATPLDDIEGLDSLKVIETVALLEDHFAVAVDSLSLDGLTTVGDIVRIIARAR